MDVTGPWLVIPDLHGDAARLEAALAVADQHPHAQLIFLGDLIDDSARRREARNARREPGEADDSREILTRVRGLVEAGRAEVLLGNHEVMALAAVLDQDQDLMEVWWQVGGREAAASFGWDGQGDAGELGSMLEWWRTQAFLWRSVGPPGARVLLSHATRPTLTRLASGSSRAADLAGTHDPVVWHPLGRDADAGQRVDSLPLLPEDHHASLHGHMETPVLWTLLDREGQPAHQLDLHPAQGQLCLMLVREDGELEPQVVGVAT